MLARNSQQSLVYAHWKGFDQPTLMGALTATSVHGKEVFSFEYDAWLKSGKAQNLDPDLKFFSGPQYLGEAKSNLGFSNSIKLHSQYKNAV